VSATAGIIAKFQWVIKGILQKNFAKVIFAEKQGGFAEF